MVLLIGWDSVAEHYEVSRPPRFEETGKVVELTSGTGVGYAQKIELWDHLKQ